MHIPGNELFMNFLRLIRWPNLLIVALVMVFMRFFLIIPKLEHFGIAVGSTNITFILLIFSVLLIAAGGYIVNDIFDEVIDRVNKPDQMLIGIKISHFKAWLYYWLLTGCGIISGFILAILAMKPFFGMIFVLMSIILFLYSTWYKRQLITGNILVSFSTAMVLVTTWIFETIFIDTILIENSDLQLVINEISLFVYVYSFFAFCTSLLREIVKDMEDIRGDEAAGCKTIPIYFGLSISKSIVFVLVLLLMIAVASWQYLLLIKGFVICSSFLFLTQLISSICLFKLLKADDQISFHRLSFLLKILMISGIASLTVLKF